MRRVSLALAAIGVGGTAVGLLLWTVKSGSESPGPTQRGAAATPSSLRSEPGPCDLSAPAGYSFRVHWAIAPELGAADFVLSASRNVGGELRAKITDIASSGGAGRASPVSEALRELGGGVFGARVSLGCRVEAYLVDASMSQGARELLRGLLLGVDVEAREEARWTVVQRDAAGSFAASYRKLDAGVRFEKRRLRYLEPERRQTSVTGGTVFAVASGWLDTLCVDETYRERGSEIDATFVLRLSSTGQPAGELGPLPAGAWVPIHAAPREASPETQLTVARKTTVDAGELLKSFRGAKGADAARLAAELGEAAKSDPAVLAELEALLKSADAQQRAALFLALRVAGTDAAQDLLASSLNRNRSESERADALLALHELTSPNEKMLDALESVMTEQSESTLGRMALLATSSLARQGGPAADLANRQLELAFQRGDKVTALEAIGNWGRSEDFPRLKGHASDPAPPVRSAGYNALRKYPAGDAIPLLLEAIRSEPDPRGLATALRSAEAFLPLPLDTLDLLVGAATSRLRGYPDRALRAQLISFLGAASRTSGAARQALVAHYPSESELELRQTIGRFLPASVLAAR